MNSYIERRKHRRVHADTAVELIWKDETNIRRFENGTVADWSPTGAGLTSPQPLDVSCKLILRVPSMNVVALACVRNCHWRRTQYHVGLEFLEKAAISPAPEVFSPDYHELLRGPIVSDPDFDRLYRNLAFRYHPDNQETGSSDVFLRIREIYQIISASRMRPVEVTISEPIRAFKWKDISNIRDKRLAVLGLLYQRRVRDYRNATVSQAEIESLTGLSNDEAGFILWYFSEKRAVTLAGTNDFMISALGIDLMEENDRQNER